MSKLLCVILLSCAVACIQANFPYKVRKSSSYVWFPVDTDEGKFVPATLKNGGGRKLDPKFDLNQIGIKQSPYDDVEILLYTQSNPTSGHRLFIGNDQALENSNYISGASLIITSHGFGGDAHSGSGKALRDMYIASGRSFNVIAVDWGQYAGAPWYDTAAANTRGVGQYMARFVEWLISKGVTSVDKVHFIGHSLGAHVAGFCGDELKKRIGSIARITGCDPALPLFGIEGPSGRLDPDDAVFVDILHTAGGNLLEGGLAFKDPIGDVDFYPNNGEPPQPGCGVDLVGSCSHSRCYEFLAESIFNPNAFRSCQCTSWDHFLGNCGCSNTAQMGHYVSHSASGLYYLRTNSDPPFGQG